MVFSWTCRCHLQLYLFFGLLALICIFATPFFPLVPYFLMVAISFKTLVEPMFFGSICRTVSSVSLFRQRLTKALKICHFFYYCALFCAKRLFIFDVASCFCFLSGDYFRGPSAYVNVKILALLFTPIALISFFWLSTVLWLGAAAFYSTEPAA